MTSPARCSTTRSPGRAPSRAISSRLCSVALVTTTPPTVTLTAGEDDHHGAATPTTEAEASGGTTTDSATAVKTAQDDADTAKAASAATGLPLVSVPTTYSGAEWTEFFGVRDPDRKMRGGGAGANLHAIVYEPKLTLDLPRAPTVGTALVAISSVIGGAVSLITILILTFYLLLEAGAMFEYLVRFIPSSRAATWRWRHGRRSRRSAPGCARSSSWPA